MHCGKSCVCLLRNIRNTDGIAMRPSAPILHAIPGKLAIATLRNAFSPIRNADLPRDPPINPRKRIPMIKNSRHSEATRERMRGPRRPHRHPRSTRDPIDRFWEKVDRRGSDECWPWLGKRTSGEFQYGVFTLDGRRGHTKLVLAHRFAYRLEHGDAALPDDLCLLHLVCDNPPCCNPRHTGPGTRADNFFDMVRKGRRVVARGQRQRDAKLSYQEADTIRWMHFVAGASHRRLARDYGASRSNIARILAGQIWVEPAGCLTFVVG